MTQMTIGTQFKLTMTLSKSQYHNYRETQISTPKYTFKQPKQLTNQNPATKQLHHTPKKKKTTKSTNSVTTHNRFQISDHKS